MSEKLKLYYLLAENPRWVDIINRAFEVERRFYQRFPENKYPGTEWLGFEWHEVHTQPATLNKMVAENILDVNYKSRSSTNYKVANPELVKQVLGMREERTGGVELAKGRAVEIPDDIFSPVIGYDDIKRFLKMTLKGQKRLHFLLEGSPATAKSLFMLCIQKAIPQSYYATGSRTTAPGLTDALFSYEPKVLLLDEIEKTDMRSYAVLLSLMESGTVVETKYRRHITGKMDTIVIGACNSSTKLPPELISRFDFHLKLKPYDRDDFVKVCKIYLSHFEDIPEDLAEYIGLKVWSSPRIPSDVRKARGIARMLDDHRRQSVDAVVEFEEKYA
jgi:DNA replicative helicase MCM subunit Mcm2 (Cdc46/Mcm family)